MTIALLILVVAISLGAVGQIALKTGINALGEKPAPLTVLRSIFTQWQVTVGFLCYGVSSLIYLIALSRLPVSYAYPMVALSYVIVSFLSWRLLHETIPLTRGLGLTLICLGVIVVALSHSGHAGAAPLPPPAAVPPPLGGGQ
jgi:multidrug transporter EmrE-like cation transporter